LLDELDAIHDRHDGVGEGKFDGERLKALKALLVICAFDHLVAGLLQHSAHHCRITGLSSTSRTDINHFGLRLSRDPDPSFAGIRCRRRIGICGVGHMDTHAGISPMLGLGSLAGSPGMSHRFPHSLPPTLGGW
jgi:hypothetical protein